MTSIAIDLLDGLSSAAAYKGPCRVATTANIALTGLQTVDGIALAAGDRVLAKDQTLGEENGIWVADTGPWRRAKDFNRTRDVVTGTQVLITAGTVNEGRIYRVSTASVIFVGTTEIDFEYVLPPLTDFGLSAAGIAIVQALSYTEIRVLLAAPKTVSTISALKASIPASEPVVFVNGAGRSHTMFEWRAGDYTALHAIDTVGVAFVKANSIASSAGSYVLISDAISPRDAGAVGDNSTDDYAALNVWHAVLMASTYKGLIDAKFKSATAFDWNWESRRINGVTVEGRNPNEDYINVTDTTTSPAMRWHSNSQALFHCRFYNFGVRTNRAGVGFQIGQDDFADAWNQCVFFGIIVNNSSANAANVSLRLNHVLGSDFFVVANAGGSGKPAEPGAPGYGTAVELRQVIGGRGAIDAGNAVIGHHYRDGASYGSTWIGTNIEEVTENIRVSVGATAQNNQYLGGYMVGSTTINSLAGNNNKLRGVNVQFYGGGSIGSSLTGWSLEYEAGSVTTWQTPTGISISSAGSPVTPGGLLHLYSASGTTRGRWQANVTDVVDFDYNGDLNIVNYKSGGSLFRNAASATGTISERINSVEKLLINSTGATVSGKMVSNDATGGIGYATGAGGTVTQLTSKATGVTLNKATGEITLNAASLAANTAVSFVLTNSAIAAGDRLILNHAAAGTFGAYIIDGRSAAGSATIVVRNLTAGALAEAIVIGFAVIKSVTA